MLRVLAAFVVALLLAIPSAASADQDVSLTSQGFVPAEITADAGETLHFTNETNGTWSVTSTADVFDSKPLKPGGSYTMSLSVPGEHTFHSTGSTQGEGTIRVHARALPGHDDDQAEAHVPALPFPPVAPGDVAISPDFGVEASKTRIIAGLKPGADVGDVNAALADANVRIIGGLPSIGTLLLQTRASGFAASFTELKKALGKLRRHEAIRYAAMSTKAEPLSVPRKADAAAHGADQRGWDWGNPFATGTWALTSSRFTEAWNTREAVARKKPTVITGIVDTGFEAHKDLPGLQIQSHACPHAGGLCRPLPNSPDSEGHGNHVAGIIGAAWDDDSAEDGRSYGVSGANPVARMFGYSAYGFDDDTPGGVGDSTLNDQNLELFDLILRSRPAAMRVINYSMGAAAFDGEDWQAKWGSKLCGPGERDDDLPDHQVPMKTTCTPNTLDAWQREMAAVGLAAAPIAREAARQGVMIVQAAGNDGRTFCQAPGQCAAIDTASRNEFSWVSRNWDEGFVGNGLPNPILTVQATMPDGSPRPDATLGADVAAPGDEILSTVLGNGYGNKGGSSMAAPQVTGLIGYLLADDPTLSLTSIRRRVLDWASAKPGGASLDFTWTMPDKMNRDVDGDELVDYPKTNTNVEPSHYPVDLDACGAGMGAQPILGYTWKVDGEVVGSTSECTFRWRAPAEGTYSVELMASGVDGALQTTTKQVEVKDLLIVSVGDSIASGEGNPDIPSPGARWQKNRCDRSAFGGPAQAARLLEGYDAKSSVTFLHLACSGARMTGDLEADDKTPKPGVLGIGGLLTPYEGVAPETNECELSGRHHLNMACEKPQLQDAQEIVGNRTPDTLLVSIGANDMRFSSILIECLKPFNDCSLDEDGGRGMFTERLALLEERYAKVAAEIENRFPDLDADKVIITQYPDPTTTEDGAVTLDCGASQGITDNEAMWAHDVVVPALNRKVAEAAQRHGWTLATGIPAAFQGHGYCSSSRWVVDISDTIFNQGDKNGGYHPTYAGHSAYAKEIVRTVREKLGLDGFTPERRLVDRAPRINAFRSVAAGGPASRIADLNDASKDGNRRVKRTIGPDGQISEAPDTTFAAEPGAKTSPDGRVDMRDLRRYRDAWLQRCLTLDTHCPPAGDILLDGGEDHVKRDLNLDGCVADGEDDCGATELFYARADVNGDQLIDPAKKMLTPWKADGSAARDRADATSMSDTDVFRSAWTGGSGAEGWTKDDLGALLKSGDLQVDASAVLDTGAPKAQLQVREKDGADVGPKRTVKRTDGSIVLTVPIDDPSQDLELITTAKTARGTQISKSAPFTLKYGEDKAIAACPDITLGASTMRVAADGEATSVITARLHKCAGRQDVAGKTVTFTLDSSEGGATVEALEPTTDGDGRAQAVFTSGTSAGKYTIKASVQADDGSEPLESEIELETVPTLQIRYLWKQSIDQWNEGGSTRWSAPSPLMPDCVLAATEYCIDTFQVGIKNQTLGGIQRAGTLVGGGDGFKLTEQVSNSAAQSEASWTLSEPDGDTEDGGQTVSWAVADNTTYTDHAVAGLKTSDRADELELSGLQAVGDLPYQYFAFASGSTDNPRETHTLDTRFLLVPQSQKILFGAHPDKELTFQRDGDGFKPFVSCGVMDEDLTSQPGYLVDGGGSVYIPGTRSLGRKTTYSPGDRPMPVGPGRMKVSYAFAAVASYSDEPAPAPVLPDCSQENAPTADFAMDPAGEEDVAKEGRDVAFADRSTDPENDIVEYRWDFGDGKSATGASAHHVYDDDGSYQVTLTTTDAKGHSDTETKELVVENEDPEATIDDATAKTDAVRVDFTMLDPGHVDKQDLEWRLTSTNPAWPTESGTAHAGVYWRGPYSGLPAGVYPITLTVTDKEGATATDYATVVITETEPPPPPPQDTTTYATCDTNVKLDAEERTLLDVINDYREQNGLQPLGVSATLTKAAERHADDMAAKDYMEHTGRDGSTPGSRAWDAGFPRTASVGENLAASETAVRSLAGWRGSSKGHNENLLNPAWRSIGLARAKGRIWRTANTYGAVLDCAATDAERVPAPAPPAGLTSTGDTSPGSDVAAKLIRPEEVEPPRAEATSDAEPAPAAPPVSAMVEAADDDEAPAPPAVHAPTVAMAFESFAPRAGVPVKVHNRSRDADNSPLAATAAFGDGSSAVAFAADEAKEHAFPESEIHRFFTYTMEGTGSTGRVAKLKSSIHVAPKVEPYLTLNLPSTPPVSGRPYKVEVGLSDGDTGDPLRGFDVTVKVDDNAVTATTGADGTTDATVTLANRGGVQTITAEFAGTADHKPTSTSEDVEVHLNRPPVAKAGGPYVIGEGHDLLLNGSRSKELDPVTLDGITAYEWDLDDDGQFDDATGRLPARIAGDQVEQKVCGGDCQTDQAYPIALRVTDRHEATGVEETTLKITPDFDLMLGNESKVLVPGSSNSFAVSVIGSKSYTKPVTLSLVDLPAGITATWSRNPITPSGISTLKLTVASNYSTDNDFTLKVKGTDGTITKQIGDPVDVAFGLVPVCKGTIAGVVTNRTTGAPMSGVSLLSDTGGVMATTDAGGRYIVDDVALGTQNAATSRSLTAQKAGFYDILTSGEVSCGAITTIDYKLIDKRQGTVNGTVVDKQSRAVIAGASITDSSTNEIATTNGDGKYTGKLPLAYNNADRPATVKADANGYWPASRQVTLKETVPATADLELLRKCTGTLVGGKVLYEGTTTPVPYAQVGLFVTSPHQIDQTVTADENGEFVVDRAVSLGSQNSAIDYKARPFPGPDSPARSVGVDGTFRVAACGSEASTTLFVRSPKLAYGKVTGRITEQTSGDVLKNELVTLCGQAGSQSCTTDRTDDNGEYVIDEVYLGEDVPSRVISVSVSPAGHYGASVNHSLKDKETKALDLKPLRRKYGAVKAKVVNSVTGAPIAGAEVRAENCNAFCITTGREGHGTDEQVELAAGNGDRSTYGSASKQGYWSQGKTVTVRAGQVTEVEYELQPECDPAKVTGSVINAETGDPISGATVTDGVKPVRTATDGKFVMDSLMPASGNNPRQVTLTASAPGFHSQSKTITIFCGAQITIDFGSRTSKTGVLKGRAYDEDTNEPLKEAFVGTTFGATATTNDLGEYRITDVPLGDLDTPREWKVTVQPKTGYKPQTKTVTVQPEGETTLDFPFSTDNSVPVADAKTVALNEDASADLVVTGSDADAADTLSYHVMSWPQHGDLTGRAPNLKYRPDNDWNGTDSFEFVVNDGGVSSARGKVDLVVAPTNDRPTAKNDHLVAAPGRTTRFSVADLLANDTDKDGDALRVTKVTLWDQAASVALDGDEVVFTPPAGWSSEDEKLFFTYEMGDQSDARESASVFVKVVDGPLPPECAPSAFTTPRATVLSKKLECTDVNGGPIAYALVAGPSSGSVDVAADGTFTYTPAAGFVGKTSFTYKATDDSGLVRTPVKVDVDVVNALPVCSPVEASSDEDEAVVIDLACTDADDDALTTAARTQPEHGTLSAAGDGRLRYTPSANWSGTDTFTYGGADDIGDSELATVTVAVAPVNDAPSCKDLAVTSDGSAAEVAPDCTDVEGDALTVEIAGQGGKGAASVAGGRLRFVPADGASGADEFRYVARDADASPAAKVAVTITRKGGDEPKEDPREEPEVEQKPAPEVKAPAVPAPPVVDPPAVARSTDGSAALLGCADKPIVLEDVIPAGRRVKLLGLVAPEHAGRRVEIRLEGSAKVVASPMVGTTGRFAATAPMPRGFSKRDRVRYIARLGDDASRALRLWRRLQVESLRTSGDKVVIAGRVTGPQAGGAAERVIEIRRQAAGCHEGAVIARAKPGKGGRFRVELPREAGESGAVYRLRTKVRNAAGARKLETTYSLPRVIDFE